MINFLLKHKNILGWKIIVSCIALYLIIIVKLISAYNKEIKRTTNFLKEQSKLYCELAENKSIEFQSSIIYLSNNQDILYLLEDDEKAELELRSLIIFANTFPGIIEQIRIYNDNVQRVFNLSENDFFEFSTIEPVQKNHPLIPSSGLPSGKSIYQQAIYDRYGNSKATLEMRINTFNFCKRLLKHFFLGRSAHQWIVEPNSQNFAFKEFSTNEKNICPLDSCFKEKTKILTQQNKYGILEYNHGQDKMILSYRSLFLFKKNFVMFFSISRDEAIQTIKKESIQVFTISTILISLIILYIILQKKINIYYQNSIKTTRKITSDLLDNIPIAMIAIEQKKRNIIEINNIACSLLSEQKEDIIGKHYEFLDKYIDCKLISDAFDIPKVTISDNKICLKSGQDVPMRYHISPIETSDIKYLLCCFVDTSQVIKIIDELDRIKKNLQSSDRAKLNFSLNISNEIKSPTTSILNLSGMLLRYKSNNLTEKQREGLHHIKIASHRILELINDMLEIMKTETGQLQIKIMPFSAEQLLGNLESAVENLRGEKKIIFTIRKLSGLEGMFLGDLRKINQVLINFVSNAVKFTEKGQVKLTIYHKDEYLFFEIVDSGIGIPEKDLNMFFGPLNEKSQYTFSSKGLGIAVCRKLLFLMEGEISAESSLGKGTTIWFHIPVKKASYKGEEPSIL